MNKVLYIFFLLITLQCINAQVQTLPPEDFRVCDEDGDGFVSIPFSEFQNYALDVLEQFDEQPEIYVTEAYNGISKITNLYNNPQVVNVCPSLGSNGYFDIAINNQKEIFIVRGSGYLQKIDAQTCSSTTIGQIHSNGQDVLALSFDHLNNLYEGGWESQVYRAEANDLTQFSLWHDFESGRASGDFVQIGDFMYIAWTRNNGMDYLYKVTLGPNNEYVSHENLGMIENRTFGLASEYGRLYGNTTDYLYEIDLETMERTIIRQRPNSSDDWWGAAGLHEALNMKITYHDDLNEAQNGTNELNSPYSNTTAFNGGTIYIRIHESSNNETYIIPINIIIDTMPIAADTSLIECFDEISGVATFDLSEAENSINPNVMNFTFYASMDDLNSNQNPLPTIYDIPETKIIYAKVKSDPASACHNIAQIELIVPSAADVDYEPNVVFCLGTTEVLSVPNDFINYQWNGLTGEDLGQNLNSNSVEITHPGNYFVTVTDTNGCSFDIPFTATLDGMPEVTDVIINGNSITVEVSPSGQYEYSLNGIFWQSSNTFHNVEIADYEIYVRDFTGCRNEGHEFIFFNVPNFISPNGDGYNDVWTIHGITQYPDAHVQIFDRYGKLFFDRKIESSDVVWDGKYLGRKIASGTYWYIITLTNEKRVSGSLLIKN